MRHASGEVFLNASMASVVAFRSNRSYPQATMPGIPIDLIDLLRVENEKAAKAAASKFEEAVRADCALGRGARARCHGRGVCRISLQRLHAGSTCRSSPRPILTSRGPIQILLTMITIDLGAPGCE